MKSIVLSRFLGQRMLVSCALLVSALAGQHAAAAGSTNRPFRMGFTGFVYDMTPEAFNASRKFVRENGDILAHHIEGVPWAQALNGQPFPKPLLEDWEGKKLATPSNGKIYLAISPGRGELKMADKAGALPAELKGKSYDDLLVMKAYLAYCRRAIDFFKPDYLAIGIEVNEIHNLGSKAGDAYGALHQHVYAELKKEHPNLPIFASWTLHNMFKQRGQMLQQFKKLMPYNDLVAVSYYPFFMADKDRLAALDWMFYGDWANICLATSSDGKTFARYRNPEGRPQLDFAGRVDTGRNTRDPMVRRIGNKWYCYYTAHPGNKGSDYARTSDDLLHWSEEHVVAARGKSGAGPYSAECPFVVEPQPGHLYLFRTQRCGKDAQTMVYHSQDPLDFGVDNDAEHYVTTLPVAAPEIFQPEGQWYMAALLPNLKGIQINRMEWVPRNEAPIINLLGSDFQGGANKTYGMEFHDRTNVNYVYAVPTATLAIMRASFELSSELTEQMHLLLDARQNEGPLSCSIEIRLNDTVLLSGPNVFPKVWHVRSFAIPKGVLKSGTNTLTIRNLEPAGAAGSPPWFMVSRCAIGPAGLALPRIINFRKYSVTVPAEARPIPEPLPPGKKPGFALRGIKGWNWTAEQYLEEIPILAEYRMNFLMNCYLSNFETEGKWINKWWEPLSEKRRQNYIKIIRECERYHINFCFAVHPQLASPRPLDPNKTEDVEAYFRHYAWVQEQGVKWFSISLDDVSWGEGGPGAGGAAHARLVNTIFDRLRRKDKDAQMIFCPVPYWGDGTKKEDREYLEALARDMRPEVYVFWTGDEVAPARMTAEAARSYKEIVKHRLVIWENYPVNDASPTMHLGPITGRDPELASIADGYLSNPLCPQNQINRIPLMTCADFAWNPAGYDPDRSIGQALRHWGKTDEQRQILKELVELYPGAILARPSKAGYRPVYSAVLAQFKNKLESRPEEARAFIGYVEDVEQRLAKAFPSLFEDARKTMQRNIAEMDAILHDTR